MKIEWALAHDGNPDVVVAVVRFDIGIPGALVAVTVVLRNEQGATAAVAGTATGDLRLVVTFTEADVAKDDLHAYCRRLAVLCAESQFRWTEGSRYE